MPPVSRYSAYRPARRAKLIGQATPRVHCAVEHPRGLQSPAGFVPREPVLARFRDARTQSNGWRSDGAARSGKLPEIDFLVPDREEKAEESIQPGEKVDSPWRSDRFANRIRARHATVHALLAAGHSRRSIGRRLHMTHRTVKSLAGAAKPKDFFRGQWQHNRTSVLDVYKPHLDGRWDEGCTNAWKLWEEIVPLGYRGGYGRVSAYLREKRTSPRPVTAQPPAPRVVTRWILSRPETLTEMEQLGAQDRPGQLP